MIGELDARRILGLNARGRAERVARALLAAAVAGCAALVIADFIIAPLTGHFSGWFEDFGPIRYAGHAANNGSDIYGAFVPQGQYTVGSDRGFDYPPLVAFLARPLAALPYSAAATLWVWITLGCTIAGAVIVAREVFPARWPRVAVGFCSAVLFVPAAYNVWHGNTNAVVFLSLAFALRAWVRGDEISCGLALAVGGATKVAPALLLVLLVKRGWWRGFLAGAGALCATLLAGGVLVGFDRLREWFTEVLPVLGRADGWYFNQGWNAVVNRLADHNVWRIDAPNPALDTTVLALSAAGIVGVVWLVRRGAASSERRSVEFAAAVIAMLLAGSTTWYSSYGHLTIPLLVVAGLAARRIGGRALVTAAAIAAAIAGVAVPLFLGGGGKNWLTGTYGTPLWWPALQLTSLPALSAAVLLAALLIWLRARPGQPTRAASALA